MRIIDNLAQATKEREVILSIGAFDGVHLGHQYLIKYLVQRARETESISAVITFHPHPRTVLYPEEPTLYLTTLQEKASLLEGLGLDLLVVLPFTPKLARTSARDFIRSICDHLRIRELWVASGFALGHNREGDVAYLRELGRQMGFDAVVIEPLSLGGEVVSSSRIRSLVMDGKVEEAAKLLGRYPFLTGRVVVGAGRGKRMGFPTANLAIDEGKVIPADGVYAVRVRLGVENHQGVANVGMRPTFDGCKLSPHKRTKSLYARRGESLQGGARTVEAHILDFEGELYGTELRLEFVKRLRPERRYASVDQLIAQMQRDVETARIILSTSTKEQESEP